MDEYLAGVLDDGADAFDEDRMDSLEWGLMRFEVEHVGTIFGHVMDKGYREGQWVAVKQVYSGDGELSGGLQQVDYPFHIDPARIVALRFADGIEVRGR